MIINGNYKKIDFERLKKDYIEAFVEYYGEKHRENITEKINNIKYHPFHTENYLNDYYEALLENYKDEINDEFFKIAKIEKNPEREKLVEYKKGKVNLLLMDYKKRSDYHNYPDDLKKYMQRNKNKVCRILGIEGTDDEKLNKLDDLFNCYNNAIKNIEEKHPCDVFDDMKMLDYNHAESIKEYLKTAKSCGYDLSFEDIGILSKEDFDCKNFIDLKSNGLLFDNEIYNPGLISAFTTLNSEYLKKGQDENIKLLIIMNRLKYLEKNGFNFQYLESKDLYNPTDDPEIVNKIMAEYEYQKRLENIPKEIDYFNVTLKELKKNYSKGEFFPARLADELEKIRNEIAAKNTKGCKFDFDLKPFTYNEGTEYFTVFNCDKEDSSKVFSDVYINEDQIFTDDDFLEILTHESNHVVSQNFKYSFEEKDNKLGIIDQIKKFPNKFKLLNKNKDNNESTILKTDETFDTKKQKSIYKVGLNYYIIDSDETSKSLYDDNIQALEEYINEAQAQEINNILKRKCKTKLVQKNDEKDIIFKNKKSKFNCFYNIYDFLVDDFYKQYYNELKEHKINPEYDIFFNREKLPFTKSERALDFVEDTYTKTFDKTKYYDNKGVLDYHKIEKLSDLICDYRDNIYPVVEDYLIRNKEGYSNYEEEYKIRKMMLDVIKRRNRILRSIDKDRKNIINYYKKIISKDIKNTPEEEINMEN